MNSEISNVFKRHMSRTSSLSQFTPLKQPSFGDDDTEVLFQLPKKQKMDEATLIKPFPKYENHLELIQSKAELAKLQSKINGLERESVEIKANFDLEREVLFREKQRLESRVADMERELSFISQKEFDARTGLETFTKNYEAEKLSLHDSVKQLNAKIFSLESELAEKNEDTDNRVQTLWLELNREKESAIEYRSCFEQMEREATRQKSTNEFLLAELKSSIEQFANTKKKYDEQSITIRQWKEENQIATALRLDTSMLKELQQENAVLKQQIQRYKNLSENTTLLKEQKSSLESAVAKYKNTVEKLTNENSELKIAIAKSHSNVQPSSVVSFQNIDYMTKYCTELKFEMQNKDDRISSLEKELLDRNLKMENLNSELKQREEYLETSVMAKLNGNSSKNDCCVQTEVAGEPNSATGDNFDVERLSQLVKEKERHIEHLMKRFGVTPDYDPSQMKILHYSMNPLADAHLTYVNELEKLQQQNSLLKLRLQEMERFRQGPSSTESNMIVDDDVTGTINRKVQDQKYQQIIDELKTEVAKLTEQRARVAKINQEVGTQFREMCTLLTGYQVKMKEDGSKWMVQSVFEKPERHFLFSKGQDGTVQLLENDYASEWKDFVDMYLITDNSIPAFLSAITLQLISKMHDSSASTVVESYEEAK